MKSINLSFLLLSLVVLLSGCTDTTNVNKDIIGEWSWAKETLVFFEDGTFEHYDTMYSNTLDNKSYCLTSGTYTEGSENTFLLQMTNSNCERRIGLKKTVALTDDKKGLCYTTPYCAAPSVKSSDTPYHLDEKGIQIK